MARFFRAPDRRQRLLLPVDMLDWLPESDIVHPIVDAVDLMDLPRFEPACEVGGQAQAPFAPRVLLALLICACSHGVRSSRVIERMTQLFGHVLELCRKAGLVRLGLVALDGTKVKADAALDANRTAGTIADTTRRPW